MTLTRTVVGTLFLLLAEAALAHEAERFAGGIADVFSKKPWQRVGLRILGSWLAASSLLVLALTASSR